MATPEQFLQYFQSQGSPYVNDPQLIDCAFNCFTHFNPINPDFHNFLYEFFIHQAKTNADPQLQEAMLLFFFDKIKELQIVDQYLQLQQVALLKRLSLVQVEFAYIAYPKTFPPMWDYVSSFHPANFCYFVKLYFDKLYLPNPSSLQDYYEIRKLMGEPLNTQLFGAICKNITDQQFSRYGIIALSGYIQWGPNINWYEDQNLLQMAQTNISQSLELIYRTCVRLNYNFPTFLFNTFPNFFDVALSSLQAQQGQQVNPNILQINLAARMFNLFFTAFNHAPDQIPTEIMQYIPTFQIQPNVFKSIFPSLQILLRLSMDNVELNQNIIGIFANFCVNLQATEGEQFLATFSTILNQNPEFLKQYFAQFDPQNELLLISTIVLCSNLPYPGIQDMLIQTCSPFFQDLTPATPTDAIRNYYLVKLLSRTSIREEPKAQAMIQAISMILQQLVPFVFNDKIIKLVQNPDGDQKMQFIYAFQNSLLPNILKTIKKIRKAGYAFPPDFLGWCLESLLSSSSALISAEFLGSLIGPSQVDQFIPPILQHIDQLSAQDQIYYINYLSLFLKNIQLPSQGATELADNNIWPPLYNIIMNADPATLPEIVYGQLLSAFSPLSVCLPGKVIQSLSPRFIQAIQNGPHALNACCQLTGQLCNTSLNPHLAQVDVQTHLQAYTFFLKQYAQMDAIRIQEPLFEKELASNYYHMVNSLLQTYKLDILSDDFINYFTEALYYSYNLPHLYKKLVKILIDMEESGFIIENLIKQFLVASLSFLYSIECTPVHYLYHKIICCTIQLHVILICKQPNDYFTMAIMQFASTIGATQRTQEQIMQYVANLKTFNPNALTIEQFVHNPDNLQIYYSLLVDRDSNSFTSS